MKRYVLWAILAAFVVAGPVGCGKKEIEALNTKVTQLEKDLASAKEQAADKTKEADEMQRQGQADAGHGGCARGGNRPSSRPSATSSSAISRPRRRKNASSPANTGDPTGLPV